MENSFELSLTEVLVEYRPHIEAALFYSDGNHTFDDVCARVLSGRAYFFCNDTAFAICEVVKFAQRTVFHVWLAGGDLTGILELTPRAEEMGRQCGADKLTLTGRKGFARALKDHGWTQTHVTMERQLS